MKILLLKDDDVCVTGLKAEDSEDNAIPVVAEADDEEGLPAPKRQKKMGRPTNAERKKREPQAPPADARSAATTAAVELKPKKQKVRQTNAAATTGIALSPPTLTSLAAATYDQVRVAT